MLKYVAWVLKSRGFIMFYFLLYKSPELYMFIDSASNSKGLSLISNVAAVYRQSITD